MGVLTGNCHLKGHFFKFGLTNNPTCERCLINGESAGQGLCDSEAIAYLRFCHLGHYRTRWLARHFIQSKGLKQTGIHSNQWWLLCKDWSKPTPHLFIHSYLHLSIHPLFLLLLSFIFQRNSLLKWIVYFVDYVLKLSYVNVMFLYCWNTNISHTAYMTVYDLSLCQILHA